MIRVMLEISDELNAAIDAARGTDPKNPFIERQLWKTKLVNDGAAAAGVERPQRPSDGRGLSSPTSTTREAGL